MRFLGRKRAQPSTTWRDGRESLGLALSSGEDVFCLVDSLFSIISSRYPEYIEWAGGRGWENRAGHFFSFYHHPVLGLLGRGEG
jgi:hypothetical protein